MLIIVGTHFPALVIAAMTLFAMALAGCSIEDAWTARRRP